MADRYWVGGSGNWSDTAHWSATSGGAGGASVPTSVDNATFDAASNATAYTMTLDVTSNVADLNIAAPASGLISVAGVGGTNFLVYGNLNITATPASWSINRLYMTPQSGTKTVRLTGTLLNGFSIAAAVGATVQLLDKLTTQSASSAAFDYVSGSFDPNGQTVEMVSTGAAGISGAVAFYNLTRTGAANKTCSLTLNADITVTSTLTITGNSETNRLLVQSNTLGTARTITAAAVALTNCDFMDIAGAGAAAPFTGTSLGDCLGNSGITFTAAADQYWYTTTTGTKLWSDAGNWFLGSGGTGGAGRVPLPQDSVVIESGCVAAGAGGSTRIQVDMPRMCKDLTMTAMSNPPTIDANVYGESIYGSLSLPAFSGAAYFNTAYAMTFYARSSATFTTGGNVIGGQFNFTGVGGTFSLQDAITLGTFALITGTLNTNGYSVTCGNRFSVTGGVLNAGASNITVAASNSTAFAIVVHSGGTWNAGTSTLKAGSSGAAVKVLQLGGGAYNNVWLSGTGAGAYQIAGNNTFNNFKADPGSIVQVTAGTTQTAATWHIDGRVATGTDAPCVFLDGAAASYLSLADSVLNSNSPDRIEAKVSLIDWTPAIGNVIAAKRASTGQLTAVFYVAVGGYLSLLPSLDGSVAFPSYNATVLLPFTDGQIGHVKYERNETTGIIKFYTSTDGSSWSQLGTDVAGPAGALFDSTSPWEIGSQLGGSNSLLAGRVFRVTGYSGATTIFDCNPALFTGSGNTMPDGADGTKTWTRNGNAQFTGTNLVTLMGATNATYTMAVTGAAFDPKFVSYRNAIFTAAKNTSHFSLDGGGNTNITFTPSRYWVGGSGNWSSTAKWALGSGGAAGAAVPTSAEDVCWDNLSNATAYTVTVDTTANCNALMLGAAPKTSGTISLTVSASLNVYGDITLLAGMTYTGGATLWTKKASGVQNITCNGSYFFGTSTAIRFDGAGTVKLLDLMTVYGSMLLAAGSFDPNGQTVSLPSSSGCQLNGAFSFYNLTRTGSANKVSTLTLASNIAVTNILTLAGSSATDRLLVSSDVFGTQRTITAAITKISNTDLMDVAAGGGTAGWGPCYAIGSGNGNAATKAVSAVTATQSLEVWADLTMPNWNASVEGDQALFFSKDNLSNTHDIMLGLGSTGTTYWDYFDSSSTRRQIFSVGSQFGFANNSRHLIKYTLDCTTTTTSVAVFHSTDGGQNWTQIGSTATLAGTAGGIRHTFTGITLNGRHAGNSVRLGNGAQIHRIRVFNSINGTMVEDFNAADADADGVTTLTPKTVGTAWTIGTAGSPASRMYGSQGDCLGNTGLTFTATYDQYFYASTTGTKLWSGAYWFLGSGGTGGAGRVPLPQDNVIFNSSSIAAGAAGSTVISMDQPRLGKDLTFTGVTSTPSLNATSMSPSLFGSLTFGAMTSVVGGSGGSYVFYGRGSHTHNFAGVSLNWGLMFYGYGGSHTLASAVTTTNRITVGYGTFNSGGYSITALHLWDEATAATKTINLGASSVTLTGDNTSIGRVWGSGGSGTTVIAGTSTIKLTNSSTASKSFANKAGETFYNVWFSGTGTGLFAISNSATFNQLKCDNPQAPVYVTATTTLTIADWQLNGNVIAAGFTDYHTDFEGRARPKKSGEVVVHGNRRVENLALAYGSWGLSIAGTGITPTITPGQPDPDGGNNAYRVQCSLGAGTTSADISFVSMGSATNSRTYCRSMMIKNNGGAGTSGILKLSGAAGSDVVTFDNTWKRLSPVNATAAVDSANFFGIGVRGTIANGPIDILIYDPMWEDVTYQSNQNPSERVKTDDVSTGAAGVHYYNTLNGNTVAAGVVTEAVGAAITPLVVQHAKQVVVSTLSTSSYAMTKSGGGVFNARYLSIQRSNVTANSIALDGYDAGSNTGWLWRANYASSQTEAIAMAESQSGAQSAFGTQSESVSLVDSPSANFFASAHQDEAVVFLDTLTNTWTTGATTSETIALADSSSNTMHAFEEIEESLELEDSPSANYIANPSVAETLALVDVVDWLFRLYPSETRKAYLLPRTFVATYPKRGPTMTKAFDPVAPTEEVVLTFEFADGLTTGETLATPTAVITVDRGTDASPTDILGILQVAGSNVLVPLAGMLVDVDYRVTVTVTTNNPQKTLTLAGVLPCRRA